MTSRTMLRLYTNSNAVKNCGFIKRSLATSGKDIQETTPPTLPKDNDDLYPAKKALKLQRALKPLITVPVNEDVGLVSGIPEEHIKTRRVCIYQPAKTAMQSGIHNVNYWQIDFDTRERWENPLMGWTSTGDPMSNLKVEFHSEKEAIAHCEKMGWEYYVQKPNAHDCKGRSYDTIFSWNKRCRSSTK